MNAPSDVGDVLVIGFDLGHGETAVFSVYSSSAAAPALLDPPGGKRGRHVTAVLEHPTRGVLIGEDAIKAGEGTLHLAFKSPHLDRPEVAEPIRLFVSRMIADLRESGRLPDGSGTETLWVFGTPSGWPAPTREQYAELLSDLCPGPVLVVPESRAALLYARDSGELSGSAHRVGGSVLISDIGSSTCDHTHVSERSGRPVDHGHIALGAGLIDKEICRGLVASSAQRHVLEKMIALSPAQGVALEYLLSLIHI